MNIPFDSLKKSLSDAAERFQGRQRLFAKEMGDDRFIYLSNKKLRNDEAGNLSGLVLNQKGLSDESADVICEIIAHAPNLTSVRLDGNRFTAKGMNSILAALEDHPLLEELNVTGNPLGAQSAAALARFVRQSPSIKVLSAGSIDVDDAGLAEIAEAVGNSKTLQNISLANNDADSKSVGALVDAVAKNQNLTNVHMAQSGQKIREQLTAGLARIKHRNLITVFPTSRECDPLVDTNRRNVGKVTDLLEGNLEELDFSQLMFITNRLPSAYKTLSYKNDNDAALQQAKSNIAALQDKMPPLPEKGAPINAFFQMNEHGYAPLDNPQLWKSGEAADVLSNLEITRDDLTRRTAKGATLLESLAHGMPTEKTVTFLNAQDIKIGARELLDREKKPNAVYNAFIERNDVTPIFQLGNWEGKSRQEIASTAEPLPEYLRSKLALHSLSQQIGSTLNHGRGR